MVLELRRDLHPRESLFPALAALIAGIILHAIDQALAFRAGPIPILLTAPIVGTLVYLHFRDVTMRWIIGLAVWGFVGSGIAVIGVYLRVVNVILPRSLTESEMVLYDFGMFLWFVCALAAVYALAAHSPRRRAVGLVLISPIAQAAFGALITLFIALILV